MTISSLTFNPFSYLFYLKKYLSDAPVSDRNCGFYIVVVRGGDVQGGDELSVTEEI